MTDKTAQDFFEKYIEQTSKYFFTLAQSGSSRINFVGESSDSKYIITFNENIQENESFYYFSEVFSGLKINSPKVLQISADRKLYIQEFLGDQTLSEIKEKEGLTERVKT